MGRIPKKLNDTLNADPEYGVCMLTGERGTRNDPLQRHHNLIYAGSQVNERFCILSIRRSVHDRASDKFVRSQLDWIMLNRADEHELLRFSKVEDLFLKRAQLNKSFGKVWESPVTSKIMY